MLIRDELIVRVQLWWFNRTPRVFIQMSHRHAFAIKEVHL